MLLFREKIPADWLPRMLANLPDVLVDHAQLERKAATKVTLTKDVTLQSDFFSDPKFLPSDGLEEKTILYRIGREIQIERALAKAQKKQNLKVPGS